MRVVWTPEAINDLEQVLAYIGQHNPTAASAVAARIDRTIESIGQFPHAGRLDPDTGCRERVVGRYPLLIVHAIDDQHDFVEIIGVFHTSRDPQTKRRP